MPDEKNEDLEVAGKLKRKEYEHELARLHVEFVKLQQWVVHQGLKVCIIFEGRDGAGKGGDKSDHRTGQSPGLSSRGVSRSDGAGRKRRCMVSVISRIYRRPARW